MALIATGRSGYTRLETGEGNVTDTYSTEYVDDVTGLSSWDNGVPSNMSGELTGDYYQTLQNIGNSNPGGTSGTISVAAASADPRGTMANVTNSMADDFFATAVPVKDELIAMTTYNGNKGVVEGLKSQGMAQVASSFNNAEGVADRNTKRYGMNLTKEQGDAQASALSSGKALAEVDTVNRATKFQNDLNKQLVSGMGSPAGITK